jgi:holin-like protein
LRGFAIILGFNLLGMLLHEAQIPLPGNVIGLLLFAGALFLGWVKLEWVETSAQFLLKHMMLFFTPLIVGTMALFPLIGQYWAAMAASLFGGTLIVLLVTGWTTQLLERKEDKTDAAG